MALAKICGLETEYGILVKGPDLNPVNGSSMLINSYVHMAHKRVGWDFIHERPGHDARGWGVDVTAPELEFQLVNAVLPNGSRFYVDHAHPEISTPECRTAREAVVYDRAAEEIIRRAMVTVRTLLGDDQDIVLYKNNSDGKGNSYGCHENYLLSREIPFGHLASSITSHFVTRQIYTGSGKVGCEAPDSDPMSVEFQISQRADFFEEEVGLETTLKRPIVNTRDEPHCDPQKYRRLHVIVGDANMSELATFLKVGVTSILLAMIEDGFFPDGLLLAHPVPAMRQVSYDLELSTPLLLADARRMTALDVQWSLLESARAYQNSAGLEAVGEAEGSQVLDLWESVMKGLETDPSTLADSVDWIAKRRLLDGYAHKHSLTFSDPRLKLIDLQYSDMRPERCLANRLGLKRLASPTEVDRAIVDPPVTTRAFFRGRCLQRWPESIAAANWDSMVFDVGDEPLRRIEMNEPLRGTKELVGDLIESSVSAKDLLRKLAS